MCHFQSHTHQLDIRHNTNDQSISQIFKAYNTSYSSTKNPMENRSRTERYSSVHNDVDESSDFNLAVN